MISGLFYIVENDPRPAIVLRELPNGKVNIIYFHENGFGIETNITEATEIAVGVFVRD